MEILLVVHGILMLFVGAIESEALTKKRIYSYVYQYIIYILFD